MPLSIQKKQVNEKIQTKLNEKIQKKHELVKIKLVLDHGSQNHITNHITTRSTYLRQRSRCTKNNQQPNEPKQNNNLHKSNKTQSIHPSLDSIQKHDINQAHHPPKPLHYISYLHQTQYHQKIHSSIKSSEAAYQPQKPTIQTIKQEIQPYNKNQSLK